MMQVQLQQVLMWHGQGLACQPIMLDKSLAYVKAL
jgi:hypothetical protein